MNQFIFEWQRSEHARVTSLLVRELFSSGFRRVIKWAVIAILVIEFLFIVVMTVMGEHDSVLRLGPLVLVVGTLAWLFYPITGRIRAWQMQHSDPNVKHPITHTLDENGYHISTHTADIDLKWPGIYKVRETPEFFLVYYSRRYAYYLPKRVIDGQEEVSKLAEWIRGRLPDGIVYEDG